MPITSSNHGLSTIDPDLINTFTRLELRVIMILESIPEKRHLSTQISKAAKTLNRMPSHFRSLKEARYYWDIMIRQSMHGYHIANLEPAPDSESAVPEVSLEKLESMFGHYIQIHDSWWKACQSLFEQLTQNPEHKDFRGALALKIYYLAGRLARPSNSESQSIEDSAEIVRLAKRMLKPSKHQAKDSDQLQPMFAFDGNLILPIFRVVIRCRIGPIRREAIALLKLYPRREGFWDSEMSAAVAEWFVDTEEEGLSPGEEISPDSRLILVRSNFVLAERKVLVECARQVKDQVREPLPPVELWW